MPVLCFTALVQIVDVTSCLPPSIITALEHSEQSIGCLPVRQSDAAFHPVARECLTEDGLVSSARFSLTSIHALRSFAHRMHRIASR